MRVTRGKSEVRRGESDTAVLGRDHSFPPTKASPAQQGWWNRVPAREDTEQRRSHSRRVGESEKINRVEWILRSDRGVTEMGKQIQNMYMHPSVASPTSPPLGSGTDHWLTAPSK